MTDPNKIKALLAASKQVLADHDLCVLMNIEVPICLDELAQAVANAEAQLNQASAISPQPDNRAAC